MKPQVLGLAYLHIPCLKPVYKALHCFNPVFKTYRFIILRNIVDQVLSKKTDFYGGVNRCC
jgi:hypothetical protein